VILVDDGMLTGMAMAAAADSVRRRGARAIIGAAPVATQAAVERLRPLLSEVVCPVTLEALDSIAGCYRDFHPVSEVEALDLLSSSAPALH
jgi:predicted phosphoribosyltransferase